MMIVPFAPGGAFDFVPASSSMVSQIARQQIVVDNRRARRA